jgi:hypothetical protein
MNENCLAAPQKREIRRARERFDVRSIAPASPMKQPAELHLGRRVALADPPHQLPALWGDRSLNH